MNNVQFFRKNEKTQEIVYVTKKCFGRQLHLTHILTREARTLYQPYHQISCGPHRLCPGLKRVLWPTFFRAMSQTLWLVLCPGLAQAGLDVKFIWTVVVILGPWVLRPRAVQSRYIMDITIAKSYLMVWIGSDLWCYAVQHTVFCPNFRREPNESTWYLELYFQWCLLYSTWPIGCITCSPKARAPNQKCRPKCKPGTPNFLHVLLNKQTNKPFWSIFSPLILQIFFCFDIEFKDKI